MNINVQNLVQQQNIIKTQSHQQLPKSQRITVIDNNSSLQNSSSKIYENKKMTDNFILPGLRDNSQGEIARSAFYNNDVVTNKSEDL